MTYSEPVRHDQPPRRSTGPQNAPWDDSSTAIHPVTGRVLPVDPAEPSRASALAALGLATGLIGLCAALTGLLAPEGLVIAAVGLLLCVGGLVRAGRPGLTGRGIAGAGLMVAVIAVALAAVAMTERYSWLNSGTNHVADAHTWLVEHWSFLDRWS